MPKKPKKWGIKFWVLMDLVSKFVYWSEIFLAKTLSLRFDGRYPQDVLCEEAGAEYMVVMLNGLDEKGHCFVMDNHYNSIQIFKNLGIRRSILPA